VAALRTTNPLLLLGLGTVAVAVGSACRSDAPWGRSIGVFVRIGLVILVLRIVLEVIFGERTPGHVLIDLPSIPLPSWAAGVSVGGPLTAEALLTAAVGGLRLAVVLVAFGAVNAVASPRELLRSLPAMLHEVAVAITVALCFVPELMASISRVREARLLRGRPTKGLAGLRGTAVPVLEDALERSGQLAASMGARGFGRSGPPRATAVRRLGLLALIFGVLLVVAGAYGLFAGGSSLPAPALLAIVGAALLWAGVSAGHRRSVRSRYRPAPFGWRSLTCAVSGWLPVAAFALVGGLGSPAVSWSAYPLSWPAAPPLAVLGILLAALPFPLVPHRTEQARQRSPQRTLVAT
jgi:energy-coupling factor transport system permease protein